MNASKDILEKKDKPPKTIRIFVNNQPVEMPDKDATGAEIKERAGVPASFKLFDADGREIADGETVKLKKEDRFTAISGQDVS
ncbi:MAG TPA: multiubiquitin domain-containing protein [Solirubrobacterales bacterium]